jgi:hypothetical protein
LRKEVWLAQRATERRRFAGVDDVSPAVTLTPMAATRWDGSRSADGVTLTSVLRVFMAAVIAASCTAQAGCGGSSDPVGFAVELTLDFDDSIDDSMLATVQSLQIEATGDETFSMSIPLGRAAHRTERLLYRPLPTTRTLSFSVHALDASSSLIGSGRRDAISLTAGKATSVELVIASAVQMDLGVDLGPHDLSMRGDLELSPDMTLTYPAAVLADHPIAYYRLDEASGSVAHDSSGNDLDGLYGSGVTHVSTGLLIEQDGAAAFAGGPWSASSIVAIARNALLEPTAAVSVECWIEPSINDNSSMTPLVAYGPDSTPYESYIITRAGDFPAAYFSTGGVGPDEAATMTAVSGTIYHLVATYDGTTAKLYVNGALAASNAQTGPLSNYDSMTGFAIGSSYENVSGNNTTFFGVIDEVAIYGTALNQTQVQKHYHVGSGSL